MKRVQQLDLLEPEIHGREEEAEFMQKHIDKTKHRLYVSWRNSKGVDCKMIGPETKCFCNHRSKEHDHTQLATKKVGCKAVRCPCQQFYYIPTHGAYDFKCLCKHSFKDHDPITRKCKKGKCTGCSGPGGKFGSTWTCSCGLKFGEHTTVVETYQERKAGGRLLGDMERMGQELDQPMAKGGLLHPEEVQKPPSKSPELSTEERKKRQLARLNHLIAANQIQQEKEYVREEIESPEVQGEISMFELYNRPHNYRKVAVELKRRV